ncbi:YkgJ family cysteine cluster protein [Loktanella sp. DJP18]|uniref:YkgJ family cysteine cluster protein n=1 Tax=Loktanella sp. DJP18 TaxID=3409788 RepID=UPI003BB79836
MATGTNSNPLDCQECGACCTFAGEVVVEATDIVLPKYLTRSVRRMIEFGSWEADDGVRVMARSACNSCVALRLKGGRYACRIYEKRPGACREFAAGSHECSLARKQAGMHTELPGAEDDVSGSAS